MKTIRFILLSALFICAGLHVVKAQSFFKLEGKINVDTGTVTMLPAGDDAYYPGGKGKYTAHIEGGRFVISDTCSYPYQFRLYVRKSPVAVYVSDYFLVEPGAQQVTCDFNASGKIPELENKNTIERKQELLPAFVQTDNYRDSIRNIFFALGKEHKLTDSITANYNHQHDSIIINRKKILNNYVISHPDSYAALWELVLRLKDSYDELYKQAFDRLSPAVRASYTGTALKRRLDQAAITAIGAKFPSLALADTSNAPVKLLGGSKEKYTLIDFWFSHCSACISEFEEYRKIYATYNARGFTIKGVSTDNKAMIPAWKEAIAKYQLTWPQYLDLAGVKAADLSVEAFPTNFLLDSEGRIIKRDISTAELAQFLSAKLK
ncbi:TlpA disulfide reductase family protein [Chitinophaga sp. Cy-1792]|uniref:TlpA family protein disulfide reductase n=1 Tax=Chitinophaga sp. Cy-1792 TaxID=2608339 RepID=UPI001423E12D|nr:TlpA disulfide reductase family protein [Chitinophaga sp. Cy-1792]NIG56728.1 AhpC/TSA family protein [Chitinophaga sp. Cy-1792]